MILLYLIFLFILFGGLKHKPIELSYTIFMKRRYVAYSMQQILCMLMPQDKKRIKAISVEYETIEIIGRCYTNIQTELET